MKWNYFKCQELFWIAISVMISKHEMLPIPGDLNLIDIVFGLNYVYLGYSIEWKLI